jgi:3-hydroxyisobutyrate dehydrogenase
MAGLEPHHSTTGVDKMRIGFIGLGRMGQGMARNVLRSQGALLVFDVNPDSAAELIAEGAEWVNSISALTQQSDVIFTSLPGPAQVAEVVLGGNGITQNMQPGLTLFDLSTSSRSLAQEIHAEFIRKGGWMLDAPVSGQPAGAASGNLALWVGGDKKIYDAHVDLLGAIGRSPRYVGPIGSGIVTKLAHNMVAYTMLLSLAEVFSMAVKAGIDPLDLWEALRLGVIGKGSTLEMLTSQFLPGTYTPASFALNLGRKDAMLAVALADELDVPMPLSTLTLGDMTEAIARGMGDDDALSFLTLQLERAGVTISVDPERLKTATN